MRHIRIGSLIVRWWMVGCLSICCPTAQAQSPQADPALSKLLKESESFRQQGNYAQAIDAATKALDLAERSSGPNDPALARILSSIGELHLIQGGYALARPYLARSLTIREKALGEQHPDVAADLNDLAATSFGEGQYAVAEPLYRRSLTIRESALGMEHPLVASSLNNLALLYRTQGRNSDAEPLLKRSLAIREKAVGPDHASLAPTLNNLASLYLTLGKYVQAEPLYVRSLTIREKAFGPEHPSVATSLNNLGGLYKAQGRYKEAEPLQTRSLAIREKLLGPTHPDVAATLHNLAALYFAQRQFARAETFYTRSLNILETTLGPEHPEIALSLNNLAVLSHEKDQNGPALTLARRASNIFRKRIVAGGTTDAAISEAAQNKSGFLNHLSLLVSNPFAQDEYGVANEALQIAQLKQASGTAAAVAKMAARFARGDDALAGLVKRKQDINVQRAKWEAQLVSTTAKPPQERNLGEEQRLRNSISLATSESDALDAELNRRFPEYQELTRPEPLAVAQIQSLLAANEAIVVYELNNTKRSYIWAIRPDGVRFVSREIDPKTVAGKVASLRSEMVFGYSGYLPKVSTGLLHELYLDFVAPVADFLGDAKHVMIVPSGPLQSLPFGMLVASAPPKSKTDGEYQQVDWLAKHYAISVLPSVGSINAFRKFARSAGSQEPFAGFGDPLIGTAGASTRGTPARLDIATMYRNLAVGAGAQGSAQIIEIADVNAIRAAPRLPETADELQAMAKTLKASTKSIWLRERATEANVKKLDLSKYRILSFATHGVMAGEIGGAGEPGLVLTPPSQGSLEDDGYLSGSEIASLRLNADWVILSACNTAAADGTPGAEGLSGLAKAFFYAGARSLLVSHWPVASEATVPLTTEMLKEYEANPAQGKAEAHRKSMLKLIETPDHPEYGHPLFWAPFVVVGEGGASTTRKASPQNKAKRQ